jgi:hypothetical protein
MAPDGWYRVGEMPLKRWFRTFRGRGSSDSADATSHSEAPVRPGKLYRDAVRDVCTNFRPKPGQDPDASFREFLEASLAEERATLQKLLSQRLAAAEDLYISRTGIFVAAAGLVAHGRADVINDVLESALELYGEGRSRPDIRKLAWVLKALLPLPEGLDPETDPQRFRLWMQANAQHLMWHPSEDRYRLRESLTASLS